MFKRTLLALSCAAALAALSAPMTRAAGGYKLVEDVEFSFEGPFGSFDRMQLQRGLQVFQEVCAGCHGIQFLAFRNLGDPGGPELPEEQIKAFMAEYYPDVFDPELDDYRATRLSDSFPANVDAGAPDLSLMAKARSGFHGPYGTGINQFFRGIGGPEYIYSLLTGYTGEEKEEASAYLYENTAFEGNWISMSPPLYGDDVDYMDGTEPTIEQHAKDVAAFLMWVAEPKMMARKDSGLTAVLFLIFLSVLLFYTNKQLWASVKNKKKVEAA
ncbi:MAG: cytochrome c1 [Pseudomonadota bacterium]